MPALIETQALSKRFPNHVAVDAIDLRVEREDGSRGGQSGRRKPRRQRIDDFDPRACRR